MGPGLPTYITFYPAVMLVAMIVGWGPGILATVAAALVTDYWILPPVGLFRYEQVIDAIGLVLFMGMGVLMSVVAGLYRRLRDRLEEVVAVRTRELQAANTSLDDSRRAALNLMDDAVVARAAAEDAFTAESRAKQEWERTFDSVPDLIAILDDQHRVLRANRAMAAKLGCTPAECVGVTCYEVVHGCGAPPGDCPHAQTVRDGKEHVAEVHEERLGGDFLVTTTPLTDLNGKMIGAVHVARDITERKHREVQLEKLNRALNALSHSGQAL